MSIEASPARRRRSPEVARAEALACARRLLLAGGPAAVTLKAVAADAGMSHANLLHHFGSAEGLQSSLMAAMVRDLADALAHAAAEMEAGRADLDDLVAITFEAFGKGGAGELSAWLSLTRQHGHLEAVGRSLADMADALARPLGSLGAHPRAAVTSTMMLVALLAMGDAVIGANMKRLLGQDDDAVRRLAQSLAPEVLRSLGRLAED